jgi:hypothetical protein
MLPKNGASLLKIFFSKKEEEKYKIERNEWADNFDDVCRKCPGALYAGIRARVISFTEVMFWVTGSPWLRLHRHSCNTHHTVAAMHLCFLKSSAAISWRCNLNESRGDTICGRFHILFVLTYCL